MAKYYNNTASAQVKSEAGRIYGVVVNSHTSGTLRFNDGLSGTTTAGVAASGVFTSTDVFSDGETATIGTVTYTFVDALSGAPYEVLIGANAAASLDNFKSAINGTAGEGTTYGLGTAANPHGTATTNTNSAQTFVYNKVGTAGNALATTTTCADVAWGETHLENGAEPSLLMMNTITFAAGSQVFNFAEPIEFYAGLYVTKGGTIDYTLIID